MDKIRVIVIDAKKQEVREEQIDNTLEAMQAIVGGLIEAAFRDRELICYVDEEGLLKDYDYGFSFSGAPQRIYVGNGFLSAVDDEGEAVDCNLKAEDVRKKILFHAR